MSEERKQRILDAITAELEQQSGEQRAGAPALSEREGVRRFVVSGEIDVVALATAVDAALGGDTLEAGPNPGAGRQAQAPAGAGSSPKGAYAQVDEGKTPDQLNASNDDGRG